MTQILRQAGCALCETEGGVPVFRGNKFRVIRAEEADFPAFYRLVWNAHVAEFSDLPALDMDIRGALAAMPAAL